MSRGQTSLSLCSEDECDEWQTQCDVAGRRISGRRLRDSLREPATPARTSTHYNTLSSVSVSAIAIDIMAAPTSRLLHSYSVIAYLHNNNLFRTIAKSDNMKFYRNRQIILSHSHKLQYGEGEFPDRFKLAVVIPLYKTNFIQVTIVID